MLENICTASTVRLRSRPLRLGCQWDFNEMHCFKIIYFGGEITYFGGGGRIEIAQSR